MYAVYSFWFVVIFTSKLEIPEDSNNVLDDVLDARQLWYKGYALPVGDFIIYISAGIGILKEK